MGVAQPQPYPVRACSFSFPLLYLGQPPLRLGVHEIGRLRRLQGGPDLRIRRAGAPVRHVGPDRARKQGGLLANQGKP